MKKIATLFTLIVSMNTAGQTFIDSKGTRIHADTSKWEWSGSDIYNKGMKNVGIGTATPKSRLDVKGYVKLGSNDLNPDISTDAEREGMIRYSTGKTLQYHNDTAWVTVASTATADTTNDAWIDDNPNTMVKLGTLSNGTTVRPDSSAFVVRDNGNTGIGTATPGSKLTVNGSVAAAYNNVTANTYTVGENDFYIIWRGTAAGTITLPVSSGSNRTGRLYYFKNASPVYTLTIDAAGSELINDRQTTLLYPEQSALLVKTNDNTAIGTTYDIVNHTRAEASYILSIFSNFSQIRLQNVITTADFSAVAYSNYDGSDFNLTTDIWTCPKTGVYKIEYMETGYHTALNAGTHNAVWIYKNTTLAAEGVNYSLINTNATLRNSVQVTAILELQQGDEIAIRTVLCNGCGATQMISPSRYLNIERL